VVKNGKYISMNDVNNISYMWNFKPEEKREISQIVIYNNSKFITNHIVYTPDMMSEFLRDEDFTGITQLWNLIPHWVVKADLGRLLIVYYKGGFYSDVDCFIQSQLRSVPGKTVFLFTEIIARSVDTLGPRSIKTDEHRIRIANYFYGTSVIKHPFFKETIEECLRRLLQMIVIEKMRKLSHQDILWLCGPDVITTVYHREKRRMSDLYLYGMNYVKHLQFGSWR
jgi:mannosyltransferase OCH1-like enzyme